MNQRLQHIANFLAQNPRLPGETGSEYLKRIKELDVTPGTTLGETASTIEIINTLKVLEVVSSIERCSSLDELKSHIIALVYRVY